MGRAISEASESDYLKLWQKFRDNFKNSTPVDLKETPQDKLKRIESLEKNHEKWYKYYFPNYCTAEPAQFHKKASNRLIKNPEWYEVRAWSRELAKTARAMMEFTYLAMTGGLRNILVVSNTHDNAERILLPFKACFEANQRLINDYGIQENYGSWKSDEFTTKKGCSFRAIGWGESPRGTRNENVRPDGILIDDLDTDEECRNEDIMKNKINWAEQALFATRSISEPTRILVNGNIIHDNCAILKFGKLADVFEVINIRDKDGKSSWKEKNTEAMIDRVLSIISYESQQKEYYNNPMDGGDTFKQLKFGKVPNLKKCNVVIYADPATSNKDKSSGSYKGVGIIAKKGFDYYIVKVFLDTMSNSKFVDALFDCYSFCRSKGIDPRLYIENNSLQDPHYEQVILPCVFEKANETTVFLPITPDDREKPEKYERIESKLEPINRLGHLIINEDETKNPHMERLVAQFKSFSRKQKRMDGPDMIEGGVHKLQEQEAVQTVGGIETFKRTNSKRF